jgi:hypothetical protein
MVKRAQTFLEEKKRMQQEEQAKEQEAHRIKSILDSMNSVIICAEFTIQELFFSL